MISIDVTYDGSALTVNPPSISVDNAHEIVIWNFVGIPNNWFPRIQFDSQEGGNRSPFGPFTTLEQRLSLVIASGRNPQAAGSYSYTASITQAVPESSAATPAHVSTQGALEVTSSLAASFSEVLVTLNEQLPEPENLVVLPQQVRICAGMTVTWNFDDRLALAEPWYPQIQFTSAPAQLNNIYFGPFSRMTVLESRVIGSGNQGVTGSYSYRAQQVNALTGDVIRRSSPDPGVDDEGDPPGGGPS